MSYRVAGQAIMPCSCNTPCPCVFGQAPTRDKCSSLFLWDIREGSADGVNLTGTKVVLVVVHPGVWAKGNWSVALILDSNATPQQRDALQRIFTGQLKGDAAQLVALVGDFKGVAVAPISYTSAAGKISFKAGELVEGAGEALKNLPGTAEIQLTNAYFPLPNLTIGKSSKVKAKVQGLDFDFNGSGMVSGPFELKG